MSSDLSVLAQAITVALAAHNFGVSFTPVRRFVPITEIKAMGNAIVVQVVAKAITPTEQNTRGYPTFDFSVDIGVQKRVNPDDLAEMDAMMGLVQAIVRFLFDGNLTIPVRPLSITNDPAYAPDHLAQHRVFTSVITATYRVALQ